MSVGWGSCESGAAGTHEDDAGDGYVERRLLQVHVRIHLESKQLRRRREQDCKTAD